MKKAVLFDMDGVLVDSYHAHWLSWLDSCVARNISMSEEQYAGLFGRPFRGFVDALCEEPLSPEEYSRWYDEKESLYRDIISRDFPEMPGAGVLIQALHEHGFHIGIASSGPRENVDCLLEHLTGANLVLATRSAGEVSRGKPHPDVFLACAEALTVLPENCIVIEDSIHGLQAAQAAGMAAVGLTGTCTAEALNPYADKVVETLGELTPAALEALIANRRPSA